MAVNKNIALMVLPPVLDKGVGIKQALMANGINCFRFLHHYPRNFGLHGRNRLPRLSRILDRRAFNRLLAERVIPTAREQRASLLIFLKPQRVHARHLQSISEVGAKVVVWCLDTVSRAPAQLSLSQVSDLTLFVDGGDVSGKGSEWLPLGTTPSRLTPMVARPWDIVIIGRLGPEYKLRRQGLLLLAALSDRFDIAFVGSTGSRYGDSYLERRLGSIAWIEKRLPYESVLELLQQSRICLNFHQDDGNMPVNPIFLDAPGQGCYEVAERRDYLKRWLAEGEGWCGIDPSEMEQSIESLLASPAALEGAAIAGRDAVRSRHTHETRVRFILERIWQ